MIDVATGFSVTKILPSRDIENFTHACEIYWLNVQGSPTKESGDLEFDNKEFRNFLASKNSEFNLRLARRHSKVGSVESSNGMICIFCERLLKDAVYNRQVNATQFTNEEIMSRELFSRTSCTEAKL